VKAWDNDSGGGDGSLEGIAEELIDAIDGYEDGYEIARRLEQDVFCSPDARLVEILDDTGLLKYRFLKTLEIEWVRTSGIQAPVLGPRVLVSKNAPESVRESVGEVIKNHEDGKSTVRFNGQGEGCGYIIEWERLTPAPQAS
jgi:hypothetical protein